MYRNIINILWKDGYTPKYALNNTAIVKHKIGDTKKEINVSEVLNNVELEGIVSDSFGWSHIGNIQSLALKDHINEIIRLIEKEIKE